MKYRFSKIGLYLYLQKLCPLPGTSLLFLSDLIGQDLLTSFTYPNQYTSFSMSKRCPYWLGPPIRFGVTLILPIAISIHFSCDRREGYLVTSGPVLVSSPASPAPRLQSSLPLRIHHSFKQLLDKLFYLSSPKLPDATHRNLLNVYFACNSTNNNSVN